MESPVKIFVDFHNCDPEGRVRLNTIGSLEDIKKNNIILKPGLEVLLDDEEGLAIIKGVVEFSTKENIWVAKFDWDTL